MLISSVLVFLRFYLEVFKKNPIVRRELLVEVVIKSASYHSISVAWLQDGC